MTPRATPTRAWGKRQWAHVAGCFLGVTICITAFCAMLVQVVPPLGAVEFPRGPVLQSKHGLVVQDGVPSSAEVLTNASGYHLLKAWSINGSSSCGLKAPWAVTAHIYDITLTVSPLFQTDEQSSTTDLALIRQAVVSTMAARGELPTHQCIPDLIASGAWSGRIVFRSGYIINGMGLFGLAVFVAFGCFTLRDFVNRQWAKLGAAKWQCKSCGYDLLGLAPTTAVCPECGFAHPPT